MAKKAFWAAVALLYIGGIFLGYFIVYDRYMQKQVPPVEVRIVHEYTEGYNNGYQRGKEQALEDIACTKFEHPIGG